MKRRHFSVGISLMLAVMAAWAVAFALAWTGRAAGADYFAAASGSGVACTQAAPCNLPTAIGTASAGDNVYVAGGTYTGAGSAVVTLTKGVALLGGWDGAGAGVPARDPALYRSVVDGEMTRRGVFISGTFTSTLDGFTIVNGNATGQINGCWNTTPGGCGGGVFVSGGYPFLLNNVISGNVAMVTGTPGANMGQGGGIFIGLASGGEVRGNIIISNAAGVPSYAIGGGLFVYYGTNVQVVGNRFELNSGQLWGGGLAVYYGRDVNVRGNVFERNTAGYGAGAYYVYTKARFEQNRVTGNSGGSGALYGETNALWIDANTIISNATTGGIDLWYFYQAPYTITNNIVARHNTASIRITPLAWAPMTATLVHNTLVGKGTGAGVLINQGAVQLAMTNTLIASHTFGINNTVVTGTVTAETTLFDTGVLTQAVNATLTNALTGPAGFAHPGALNYHLFTGSAARDAGVPTWLAADVDGDPRPIGAAPDIGADEALPVQEIYLPAIMR